MSVPIVPNASSLFMDPFFFTDDARWSVSSVERGIGFSAGGARMGVIKADHEHEVVCLSDCCLLLEVDVWEVKRAPRD